MAEFFIDAQTIPLAERYSFIFKTLENLSYNENLIIINDQDPLPSLTRLTKMNEKDFDLEYIEQGPATWKIKMRKTKKEGCCGCCGT